MKRDKVDLDVKRETNVHYYLDTSLILGALDLSLYTDRCYSMDLISVILQSGSSVFVHPITIEEIKTILHAVANEGEPRPNTPIAEAFYRRKLTPTKLMSIAGRIEQEISSLGVIIDPQNIDLNKVKRDYKNKPKVRELEKTRSLENNGLRDVHDVFMWEYIQKKQGNIASREKAKAYFLTKNKELIAFFASPTVPQLLSPSKIIFELWLHRGLSSSMADAYLTEALSRCIALNQYSAWHKIQQIALRYNEELDPKTYHLIYQGLIDRSNEIIEVTDMALHEEGAGISERQHIGEKLQKEALAYGASIAKECDAQKEEIEQLTKSFQTYKKESEDAYQAMIQISKRKTKDTIQALNEKWRKYLDTEGEISSLISKTNHRERTLLRPLHIGICLEGTIIFLTIAGLFFISGLSDVFLMEFINMPIVQKIPICFRPIILILLIYFCARKRSYLLNYRLKKSHLLDNDHDYQSMKQELFDKEQERKRLKEEIDEIERSNTDTFSKD